MKRNIIITTIISVFMYLLMFMLLYLDKDLMGVKRTFVLIIVPFWVFSIFPAFVYNIKSLKENGKTSEVVAHIIFYGIIFRIILSPYFMVKFYTSYFKPHNKQEETS